MLSCKEVTTLHATERIGTASLKTRIGFRVHLMMCRHCRRYVREIARIGAAMRALYAEMTDEAKDEALLRRVLRSMHESGGLT